METQGVVIYGSQFEAQADQFWINNPEYVLVFIAVIVAVFLGGKLYQWLKNKRFKRGRWS